MMCRQSCYYHMRHFLGSSIVATCTCCIAFFLRRIDYCNRLYAGYTQTVLQGLQRVQSIASMLLTGTERLECLAAHTGSSHGFLYRVGYNTIYVRWCMTSCMAPRLATSGICAVRVEICDCNRVLVGTTSIHSVGFPWNRIPCRVTFAMRLLEQFGNSLKTHLSLPLSLSLFFTYFNSNNFLPF